MTDRYLQVLNDGTRRVVRHPNYRKGSKDGPLLTSDELVEHGFYLVVDTPPAFDPTVERLTVAPVDDWPIEGGRATMLYLAVPLPPADRRDVNAERDRRYRLGTTIDLGDGLLVPVDTRHDDDETNIQGLFSFGQEMERRGVSVNTTFRGADNQDYDLTVPQLIDMGLKIMAFKQAVYAAARAVKTEIDAGRLALKKDISAAFDEALERL